MITYDEIPGIIARIRVLKAQKDVLEYQLKALYDELSPLVKSAGGSWADGKGYAKFITRQPTVSFEGKSVNVLAESWSESDDPVMSSCGEILLRYRKFKAGSQYLQVR